MGWFGGVGWGCGWNEGGLRLVGWVGWGGWGGLGWVLIISAYRSVTEPSIINIPHR